MSNETKYVIRIFETSRHNSKNVKIFSWWTPISKYFCFLYFLNINNEKYQLILALSVSKQSMQLWSKTKGPKNLISENQRKIVFTRCCTVPRKIRILQNKQPLTSQLYTMGCKRMLGSKTCYTKCEIFSELYNIYCNFGWSSKCEQKMAPLRIESQYGRVKWDNWV